MGLVDIWTNCSPLTIECNFLMYIEEPENYNVYWRAGEMLDGFVYAVSVYVCL